VENQRREISIPVSSTASSTSSLLFENKELDQVALIAKVNKKGKGIAQPNRLGPYSFRSYIQGFRFKSSKGFGAKRGKGFGSFGVPFRSTFGKGKSGGFKGRGGKGIPPSPRKPMSGKYPLFSKVIDAYAMVARTCSFLHSKIDWPRCAMSQSPFLFVYERPKQRKNRIRVGKTDFGRISSNRGSQIGEQKRCQTFSPMVRNIKKATTKSNIA
jgi:hypothetical protein